MLTANAKQRVQQTEKEREAEREREFQIEASGFSCNWQSKRSNLNPEGGDRKPLFQELARNCFRNQARAVTGTGGGLQQPGRLVQELPL